MKKIFIIFAFLLSSLSVFAEEFSVNGVTLNNDEVKKIDIYLNGNTAEDTGFQFNLTLPEGIIPVMEGNEVVITTSDRLSSSFVLRGSKVSDGSFLFTYVATDREPISGTSGTLFSISLQNTSALNGSYTGIISNITVSNMYGNERLLTDASFPITLEHKYTLTYYLDGDKYKEISYDYGDAITPEPDPVKDGYTFSGWSEIPSTMPAHDVDVTGSFAIKKFNISFVNEDGTLLQSSDVEYGTTPVYSGETPKKESSAEYSYSFSGWSPQIVAVTAAATYTAIYTSTPNQYQLIYKVDGTIYKEYTIDFGEAITPEAEPVKEGYTFSGWSEIPSTMPAHNVEVNGSFSKGAYKLTYYLDGDKYKEISYDYGDAITPEPDPVKDEYTFSGWSEIPSTMPAHDVDVTGSFAIKKFNISFVNEDGTLLLSSDVEYGTTPVYSGETPKKESSAEYSYSFSGWSPQIVAVTAAATYTAIYTSTPNQYQLIYKVDGTIYKEYTIDFGEAITPEAEPVKEGYTFSGWSEIPSPMPAHNVEVNGSFDVNIYKVSYFVENTLIHEDEVAFGSEFELWTYVPDDNNITFVGWIGEMYDTMPAHDISFTADITTGIGDIYNETEIVGIYTIEGKKVEKVQQGFYVILLKDGSRKLFLAK